MLTIHLLPVSASPDESINMAEIRSKRVIYYFYLVSKLAEVYSSWFPVSIRHPVRGRSCIEGLQRIHIWSRAIISGNQIRMKSPIKARKRTQ